MTRPASPASRRARAACRRHSRRAWARRGPPLPSPFLTRRTPPKAPPTSLSPHRQQCRPEPAGLGAAPDAQSLHTGLGRPAPPLPPPSPATQMHRPGARVTRMTRRRGIRRSHPKPKRFRQLAAASRSPLVTHPHRQCEGIPIWGRGGNTGKGGLGIEEPAVAIAGRDGQLKVGGRERSGE